MRLVPGTAGVMSSRKRLLRTSAAGPARTVAPEASRAVLMKVLAEPRAAARVPCVALMAPRASRTQ
jgi:hypothetical protein